MWNFRKSSDGDFGDQSVANQSLNSTRPVWIWTERILLICGLVLLAVCGAARIEGFLSSRAALEKFAALNSSAISANQNGEDDVSSLHDMDSPEVDFSLWDKHLAHAYKVGSTEQSDELLGVLRIPKIHLEVPILDGTDDLTLNHAVGRIVGTSRPGELGNIGIAGHRDGFFRGLKDVVVGDAVELKTLNSTDTYVVDQIAIVSPDDVAVLQPRSVPSLTLVTCYPFYFVGSAPQRYIITASLIREIKSGSSNPILDPPSQISSSKKEKQ